MAGYIGQLLMPDMYDSAKEGQADGQAIRQRKTLAQYAQPALNGDQGALAKIYGVDPSAGLQVQQNAGKLSDDAHKRLADFTHTVAALAQNGDLDSAKAYYRSNIGQVQSATGMNLGPELDPGMLPHIQQIASALNPTDKKDLIDAAPGHSYLDPATMRPVYTAPDAAPKEPPAIAELRALQQNPDLFKIKAQLAAAGRAPAGDNALQQRIGMARQLGASDDQVRAMVLGSAAGDAPATQLGDGSKTGDEYLSTIADPGLRQQIQAIAEGRMPLPKVSRPGKGGQISPQDLQKAVAQYDPTYDQGDPASRLKGRTYFTTGDGSKQARSLNTLIGHLAGLAEASDALHNGSSSYVNAAENAVGKAFGSTKATNFDSAAGPVASEFATLLKGGVPAEGEIEAQKALLNNSRAPGQLKGTIGTMAAQALSRLDALEKQKQQALGPYANKVDILSPDGRAALEKLRKAGLIGSFDLAEPDNAAATKAPSGNGWAIQKVSN